MKLLSTLMRRFVTTGRLTIIDHKGLRHEFGPGGDPSATIRITDPKLVEPRFFTAGFSILKGNRSQHVGHDGIVGDVTFNHNVNAQATTNPPSAGRL